MALKAFSPEAESHVFGIIRLFFSQIVEIVLVFPCKEDPLSNLSCNPSCNNNIKNPYYESENVIKDTLAKVTAIAPSLIGSY